MGVEYVVSDDSQEELDSMQERLEDTRVKMELETLVFIEATKKFTSEWIQREMEIAANSPENAVFPENLRLHNKKAGESNLDLKELSLKISDIVETHLNHGDYWIHRNVLLQPDSSRDYVEFKKEKIRKDLTSSVRKILGCATEIFWKLEEGEPENKAWVNELGRRKYVCFLRFSDEMTASLNHYFELLEKLLILNHKIKEEILLEGKKP
ncbi:hypothetical protein MSBRW_3411 [Methanosarcina barkeri str. Wiesmoor]|uniref:Uncharacterized protein n=2 Tax=Methanosarcina barkeri TaxID=2208 RepID=A0A0E3QND8_METBA|nr:hypothetical protein [Methanosarcina barkeri]AKB52664.1 hypothetical protein MSBRW_3411 [Methanosarcina barkeri str. Wiesmoor]